MSANCCDERNFVEKPNANDKSNIFVVFQDIFRHDHILDHHWFRLSPGIFPFQSMNVFFVNVFRSSDITRSNGTVKDEILGDDVFEVSCRRLSDLRIEISSLFSVLYLALAVSFFIFLHCLYQCDLTISSVVIMQTILVHHKMQLLAYLVHGEHVIR